MEGFVYSQFMCNRSKMTITCTSIVCTYYLLRLSHTCAHDVHVSLLINCVCPSITGGQWKQFDLKIHVQEVVSLAIEC